MLNFQDSFLNSFERHLGNYSLSTLPTTLPETNIAPENRPLEKEIPIGNHHF